VTLRVSLVVPDGEIWSGRARMVIAKTAGEGDIGILTGHPPVLGLLAEASLVRIMDAEDEGGESGGRQVVAAVSEGFLSVADDRVSVLARQAQLGSQVDTAAAESVISGAETAPPGQPEPVEVRYSRALLRAAGERS
jgi:F-type H+-transporting ATPase subunit epsilon